MPRYAKVILGLCLGLALILVLAVSLLASFNWNYARPWVNRQASELADRSVAIQGDLDVQWIRPHDEPGWRSEEHTSELQSLMRISYAVFCLKKKTKKVYTKM